MWSMLRCMTASQRAVSTTPGAFCFLAQQGQRELHRAERIAQLVADGAIEALEALGLLLDGLRCTRRRRCPRWSACRICIARFSRPSTATHSSDDGARPSRRVSLGDEALEHAIRGSRTRAPAGAPTLAAGERIRPSSRAFSMHRGVGADLLGLGRAQIAADLVQEHRDVVEQAAARERRRCTPTDRTLRELLEPAGRQARCLRLDPRGQNVGVATRVARACRQRECLPAS